MEYQINKSLASKLCECETCGSVELKESMAYIPPEDGFGINYFPELGATCRVCLMVEFKKMTKEYGLGLVVKVRISEIRETIYENHNIIENYEYVLLLLNILEEELKNGKIYYKHQRDKR